MLELRGPTLTHPAHPPAAFPLEAKSLWSQGDSSPQACDLPHHFALHQASASWLSPRAGSAS